MIASGLLCLALNIYWEARNEPIETQIGVAAVTMNRVKDKEHPNSICEVVYKPGSFSWTYESYKKKIKHEDQLKNEKERKAFIRAKQIASLYIQGKLKNPIGQRKFFNNNYLGKRHETPYEPIRLSKLLYY